MTVDLFDVDFNSDGLAIAKAFFNSINDIRFKDRIGRVLEHQHVADEFHGCSFPDDIEADEEPFDGVKFRFNEEEIVVDDNTFMELVTAACERYMEVHPERSLGLQAIISSAVSRKT